MPSPGSNCALVLGTSCHNLFCVGQQKVQLLLSLFGTGVYVSVCVFWLFVCCFLFTSRAAVSVFLPCLPGIEKYTSVFPGRVILWYFQYYLDVNCLSLKKTFSFLCSKNSRGRERERERKGWEGGRERGTRRGPFQYCDRSPRATITGESFQHFVEGKWEVVSTTK